MQLKALLQKLDAKSTRGSLDVEVQSICYDSRRAQKNSLFVALRGEHADGHNFISHAIENGAVAVVCEEESVSGKATCILVADTRRAMADLALVFFRNPTGKLKLSGVTGTNGKTTTAFLLKHLCERAGLNCGLIGTVRYEIGERVL